MSEQNNQPEQLPEVKNIFQAMACVMSDIEAISKDAVNKQQGFNYRGIDDVYNVLHPILAKHGIFTTPSSILNQSRTERITKNGGILAFVTLDVEYTFWHESGSSVKCIVTGEGMDSGDKATAKAMSIAHKYALLQTFSIPTAELIDQEADSYQDIQPELTGYEESIKTANSMQELAEVWGSIPKPLLQQLSALKDQRKQELANATANGGMVSGQTSESNSK